ncbi:hypothetical protein NDU88_004403 [Pleurodeles waltl]|uniref:Uncharacterized protein n=1 Tax=Pleurodeles waltl TaxID=8319 RepID=A0AAV7T809_PLEWA|nr:hypothetical protein NDU88_004403 [Pleurodeles waltl]
MQRLVPGCLREWPHTGIELAGGMLSARPLDGVGWESSVPLVTFNLETLRVVSSLWGSGIMQHRGDSPWAQAPGRVVSPTTPQCYLGPKTVSSMGARKREASHGPTEASQ